tara:strand:- start:822 stop:998 length:177 start_codon:yes stop_codon:yes gene_type:complete
MESLHSRQTTTAEKIIKPVRTDDVDQRFFGFLKIVRTTTLSNFPDVVLVNPPLPQCSR